MTSMTDSEFMTLLTTTDNEMRFLQRLLDSAIADVKAWDENGENTEITPLERQQHKESLLLAYGRFRVLQGRVLEQLGLLQRMRQQQQSAKDAFLAGWETRLTDIAARATGEGYAQLHDLLEQIAGEDSLPF